MGTHGGTPVYAPGLVLVTFKSFVDPKARRNMVTERKGFIRRWNTERDTILIEVPEGTEAETVEYFCRAPGVVLANQVSADAVR